MAPAKLHGSRAMRVGEKILHQWPQAKNFSKTGWGACPITCSFARCRFRERMTPAPKMRRCGMKLWNGVFLSRSGVAFAHLIRGRNTTKRKTIFPPLERGTSKISCWARLCPLRIRGTLWQGFGITVLMLKPPWPKCSSR